MYAPLQHGAAASVERAGALANLPSGIVDAILRNPDGTRIGTFEKRSGLWIMGSALDFSGVPDSPRATIDGNQGPATTLTLVAGHGLANNYYVSVRTAAGVYLALHRQLSSVGATSATLSGAAVTVSDGDELVLEGVPSGHPLEGLVSATSGGVLLFDGGLVTSLARTRVGLVSARAVSLTQEINVVAQGEVLLNGAPAANSYYGCGYEHNSGGARFGAINLNNGGTWQTGVAFAASSTVASGHTTGAPTHESVRRAILATNRCVADGTRYELNIEGGTAGSGTGTTSADSSAANTNVLPFFVAAIPASGETLAWRVTSFRGYWRT